MKTLKFFSVLLLAVVFFTACKDEDEGTPRQVTTTYTYTQPLRGSDGVKGELPLAAITLADVIGTVPANNLQRADMQLANSYLEITGLSEIDPPNDSVAVVLEDFTVKVGTRPGVNLGDATVNPQGINEFASDVPQSSNKIINLIQSIFADLTTGGKTTTITVSFTPNVPITTADNVDLVISFGGTYHYVEFE